ncbi:SsgA family sporulation/cell division regulator [Kitasatospora aureofaciens]|uniref:SsgA family sporulation/cell division regulator n=1 Tax=Kitasatospora aureofaciens TaxID=1894 RepID=UPI000691DBB1|nr:SsgA family sporulation/cell division regulator [Streptomyces viridifaciens]UKZ10000.1 SsgA family sporulation/cell division regulator [Streptomyces viridifaciens]
MPAHQSLPNSSQPRPEVTSTEIRLDARLVLGEHESLGVPVHLGYRSDDPFVVALEFLGQATEGGVWQFSRDLLWEGLQRPAGLGDVRIWPPCTCHGRTALRVMLRNRDDAVLVDLPSRQVRRWLRREVFALVPRGTEADAIDWDAELPRPAG